MMVKLYRNNVKIRQTVDKNGIYMWQVARERGLHPTRLSNLLREEISPRSELYREIMNAIDKLVIEKEMEDNAKAK